jgi:hypothetical protein
MYLCNLINSLPTRESDPYICKLPNDSVKNSEWLKICSLDIVCGIEVLWAILGRGCHNSAMFPELSHTFHTLTCISESGINRLGIRDFHARRSSQNLCTHQNLEMKNKWFGVNTFEVSSPDASGFTQSLGFSVVVGLSPSEGCRHDASLVNVR